MISARDELLHLVSTLSDAECERALKLLAPLCPYRGPACPSSGEDDLDLLVWGEDEHVTCHTCDFIWDPNRGGPLRR
jgi:hypothetical protein